MTRVVGYSVIGGICSHRALVAYSSNLSIVLLVVYIVQGNIGGYEYIRSVYSVYRV